MPKPRKSQIYTRAGDRGQTGLFGGRRVRKDDPRIIAYGTIDELNSTIGVARSFIRQRAVDAILESVQNELFNIGAELASDRPVRRGKTQAGVFALDAARILWIEKLIDEYDAKLPPLRTFILPAGTTAASTVHLARTVCRRAERAVVTLGGIESVNQFIAAYLNRLNDLLFVLARYLNKAGRRRELTWRKDL